MNEVKASVFRRWPVTAPYRGEQTTRLTGGHDFWGGFLGDEGVFLNWLSRQAKAHPVLQRAHISKGYLYPLFVIPYQIFIQYVNEFLDAYSCPVPVVKHLVFQTAKQPFAGGIVRAASGAVPTVQYGSIPSKQSTIWER